MARAASHEAASRARRRRRGAPLRKMKTVPIARLRPEASQIVFCIPTQGEGMRTKPATAAPAMVPTVLAA